MALRILPLIAIPLIIYNIIALLASGPDTDAVFRRILFSIPLPSGGRWSFSWGDVVLLLTFVLLFVELIKSTFTSISVMIDHMLATVVFIICLIEFLVVKSCATSVFFMIMTAALIDVVAGFSISMRAARRDINFGGS